MKLKVTFIAIFYAKSKFSTCNVGAFLNSSRGSLPIRTLSELFGGEPMQSKKGSFYFKFNFARRAPSNIALYLFLRFFAL